MACMDNSCLAKVAGVLDSQNEPIHEHDLAEMIQLFILMV